MKKLLVLVLIVFASPAAAQPKFPKVVAAESASSKLPADTLYIVESDKPYLLLEAPEGIVSVLEKAGPLTVFGKFVDGTGKYELREFKEKHVWIVQATGSGKVTLLMVPHGTPKASDVVRKTLEVGSGTDPPPKERVKSLTFLVIGPTLKTAEITESAEFRVWLKANRINIYGISTKEQLDASPNFAGLPTHSIVLQDESNKVIAAEAFINIANVADAKKFVSQYLGK